MSRSSPLFRLYEAIQSPQNYIDIRISEKLATNIAMEVNAAISRIRSVILLSFTCYVFILFRYCSRVNRNRFRLVNDGKLENKS
jgi:hypothetical protein